MHVYVSLMDISWERLEWNLYKSMSLKPLVNNCWIKCLPCFTLSFTLINGKRGHDSIQSTSFYRVLRTRHPDGLHQKKKKRNISTMPPSCHPTWHLNHLHPIVSNEQKNHRQRESGGRRRAGKEQAAAKKEAWRKWERDPFCVSVKHWFHHWTKTHNFKSEIKY